MEKTRWRRVWGLGVLSGEDVESRGREMIEGVLMVEDGGIDGGM